MGDVVCLDITHNAAIQEAFSGGAVDYVPQAATILPEMRAPKLACRLA